MVTNDNDYAPVPEDDDNEPNEDGGNKPNDPVEPSGDMTPFECHLPDYDKRILGAVELSGVICHWTMNTRRVGELLVAAYDADATILDTLISMGHPRALLVTLERIGRGVLMPELASATRDIQALLPQEQLRVLEKRVDVLVQREDGDWDKIQVDLVRSPKSVRRQVIDGPVLRGLDEQRVWLLENAMVEDRNGTSKWRVLNNGTVRVDGPTYLTRAELRAMLRAVE